MATAQSSHAPLLTALSTLAATASTSAELMAQIAKKLNSTLLRYNWVGFYTIEERPGSEPVLVLGPFAGTVGTYSEIPLHQGICGAVATSGETIVLNDIGDDPRYVARDLSARSELVVAFWVNGKVAGIMDVNSHFPDAFTTADRQLCETVAFLVGKYISDRQL